MIYRFSFIVLLLCLGIDGCSNDRTIYIKTSDAHGIGEKTKIYLRGTPIGEITGLEFVEDGIVFEASLHPTVQLPKDSQCFIDYYDLLTKMVNIKKGNSKRFLKEGDTLNFIPQNEGVNKDLVEDVKEYLKEITGVNQRDSMMQQLNRLNTSLEEIEQALKRKETEPASNNK